MGQVGQRENRKRHNKEEVGQKAGVSGMPGVISHGTPPLVNGFNKTDEW